MIQISHHKANELMKLDKELLAFFAKTTMIEQLQIFGYQNKLFSLSPKHIVFPDNDLNAFINFKNQYHEAFSRLCFLFGIYFVQQQKFRGKANNIKAAIDDERTRHRIDKLRKVRFIDKLRKHFFEVQDLINNGASFPIAAAYLKRHHAQYYAGYKISASYLRRTYLKLETEFNTKRSK